MKKIQTVLIRAILKTIFWLCSFHKIEENLVVFADERQPKLSRNMQLVCNELASRNKYNIVTLLPKGKGILSRLSDMAKFTCYYARAGYIVLEDYYYPLYVNKRREGTRVIQLWHSCGPFKKFGYQCLDDGFGLTRAFVKKYPIHTNYTDIPVCSEATIQCLCDGFNISEEAGKDVFIPTGLPRTDIFFSSDFKTKSYEKLMNVFPEAKGRKVILYAPTFRGEIFEAKYEAPLDLEKFQTALGKEYVLVTKLHPFIKQQIPSSLKTVEFYRDVTHKLTIEEAMCIADICITDYSSLIFEYALFERPMIFYVYDFDTYMAYRGTYYDYETFIPGKMVKTEKELLEAIQTLDGWYKKDVVTAFKNTYMCYCEGNSTQKIVDRCFH